MAVGATSSFSFDVDFAPLGVPSGAGLTDFGTIRPSRLGVSPTFLTVNVDPNSANDSVTFTTTASSAVCGNGAIEGSEICDDGNVAAGDGCDASCSIEPGWACAGEPSDCGAASCGDGIAVREETCDDGNTAAGDGCSPACLVETGWSCSGEPSRCEAVACGDGIVAGAEECDDGNTRGRDGCSQRCELEAGYVCEDEPSVCTSACAAHSIFDPHAGKCVQWSVVRSLACSAEPGAAGSLSPLLVLGLLGLMCARRRQR